ncbi:MAG: DMT family transporter [Chloroflexi bacterium]|nr:DMT family transporter [Chloroflexota bacterium]
MTAIIAGVATALIWTVATLASARASRAIGPPSALAAVALIGFVVAMPLFLMGPPGPSDPSEALPWLLVAGGGNFVGLLLNYTAMTRGKVSIVAPITSTEGAIAASIAILAGEPVTAALITAMSVVVVGVVLTAWGPEGDEGSTRKGGPAFLAMAMGSAVLFGVSLYSVGHVSSLVPGTWIVAAGRIVGVLCLTLPLLLLGRFRMTREALPFVMVCGVAEVAGFLVVAWGTQDSIAVTAVLSSQFAVLVPLVSMTLFKERLLRHQFLGAVLTGLGVGAVTFVQL